MSRKRCKRLSKEERIALFGKRTEANAGIGWFTPGFQTEYKERVEHDPIRLEMGKLEEDEL